MPAAASSAVYDRHPFTGVAMDTCTQSVPFHCWIWVLPQLLPYALQKVTVRSSPAQGALSVHVPELLFAARKEISGPANSSFAHDVKVKMQNANPVSVIRKCFLIKWV